MGTAGRFFRPSHALLTVRAALVGFTANVLSQRNKRASDEDNTTEFHTPRQRQRQNSDSVHSSFFRISEKDSRSKVKSTSLFDSLADAKVHFPGATISRTALEEFSTPPHPNNHILSSSLSSWTATSATDSPEVYDFVIVGGGNAGQAALRELQQQCPGATIALIEPLERSSQTTRIQEYRTIATAIDPHRRIIELDGEDASSSSSSSVPHSTNRSTTSSRPRTSKIPSTVQYRQAVLIATGARAAPPPTYLIDTTAWPHLWELRSTQHQTLANKQRHNPSTANPSDPLQSDQDAVSKTKPQGPSQVRHAVLQSARHGQRLAILGSGWDAVDLALTAASQPGRPPQRQRTRRAYYHNNHGKGNPHVSLVFGAAGPMSHVLPPYLSSAVAKRLRVRRIDVQERSMVRYISFDDLQQRLELYTAKSYDVLDTNRLPFDKIVVAPDVQGSRGSAWLPTDKVPPHLREGREDRPWYETWSQMSVANKIEQPLIMCFQDDGRIAVNSELYACTGVYAAGSVAKWANAFNGQAQPAGWGAIDAYDAGVVAGSNMARHYQSALTSLGSSPHFSNSGGTSTEVVPAPIRVKDPFPIWRSDFLSYDVHKPSHLSEAGITALCVGMCDAGRYSTHGVWWTNQSAQKRFLREFSHSAKTKEDEKKLRTKAKEEVTKSVYGIGVVYYLDQTGKIQGIMLWGLPFSMADNNLKQSLLETIREILLNNGRDAKSYDYFTEKSRLLALRAFSDGSQQSIADKLRLDLKNLPRPLHRYTSIFTVSNTMKRRGHGSTQSKIHDDGLFARTQHDNDNPDTMPPVQPKAGIGFDDASNPAFQQAQKVYGYQLWEQKEHQWDDNATMAVPPGEDIIWIRKGYEEKNTSARDKNIEMFNTALGRKASSSAITANASYN